MAKTLKRRIKQLEIESTSNRSHTFDLVKIIVEQRYEIERLRSLGDIEFEAYLKEAEQKLIDPRDESSMAKRAALRYVLQEKLQEREIKAKTNIELGDIPSPP